MTDYKTLRKIDGEDYIKVSEHEELCKPWVELQSSLNELQEGLKSLGIPMSSLLYNLKSAEN